MLIGYIHIDLFDCDTIAESNLNRQIFATEKTLEQEKVIAAANRIFEINSNAKVTANKIFFNSETVFEIDFTEFDYVVDAIDTVTSKLLLIEKCKEFGVPIISSMGTGNKLDPTAFKITDIYKTDTCPLCRVMRRELKARGVKKLKVLYSTEIPKNDGERTPASISFVPSTAGLIIAGCVVEELIKVEN